MLRSAQPSQFSTYPSQYIDTPGLAVLNLYENGKDKKQGSKPEIFLSLECVFTLILFSIFNLLQQ